MMKVAHLIDSAGLYGAEQVLLTLCKQQQMQGLQPVIVSCGLPGESNKAIEVAAVAAGIDLMVWRMAAGINRKETLRLLAQLKEIDVTIIHSHGYKFNILIGLVYRKELAMFRVSTVHGYVKAKFLSKMWIYELLDRLILKRFDAVVLVSEKMREMSAFRNKRSVCVIKNGIAELHASTSTVLESVPFKLLAVGRLSPEKGFSYLIRALTEINKTNINSCHLTIFGDGGLRIELEQLAAELGQTQNITFTGFVADAQQYFHQYQLIVMPSLTEGIPVTLLEAMRNKMPIMASSVGGIPDVLGAQYPYLLAPGSVGDLTEKLKRWIALPVEQKKICVDQNHEKYKQQFTATIMAEKYLALYQGANQSFNQEAGQ